MPLILGEAVSSRGCMAPRNRGQGASTPRESKPDGQEAIPSGRSFDTNGFGSLALDHVTNAVSAGPTLMLCLQPT